MTVLGGPRSAPPGPQLRMRVGAGRGLSRLEREGVLVSLTQAGRGLAPDPGRGRLGSRTLLPPPSSQPGSQPGGPVLPLSLRFFCAGDMAGQRDRMSHPNQTLIWSWMWQSRSGPLCSVSWRPQASWVLGGCGPEVKRTATRNRWLGLPLHAVPEASLCPAFLSSTLESQGCWPPPAPPLPSGWEPGSW